MILFLLLRRPIIDGDNWWRGHAAAFLNYVNLTPEVLRQGRVNQVIYFNDLTFPCVTART